MTNPNTRLGGVKQELSIFKSKLSSSFEKLENSINIKFSDINTWLDKNENKIKKSVTDKVDESIMSTKNSIIDALKDENLKLQNKVKQLEEQLLELDHKSNSLNQYNWRNKLKILEIPTNTAHENLEEKVTDFLSSVGSKVEGADIEKCRNLVMQILKIW